MQSLLKWWFQDSRICQHQGNRCSCIISWWVLVHFWWSCNEENLCFGRLIWFTFVTNMILHYLKTQKWCNSYNVSSGFKKDCRVISAYSESSTAKYEPFVLNLRPVTKRRGGWMWVLHVITIAAIRSQIKLKQAHRLVWRLLCMIYHVVNGINCRNSFKFLCNNFKIYIILLSTPNCSITWHSRLARYSVTKALTRSRNSIHVSRLCSFLFFSASFIENTVSVHFRVTDRIQKRIFSNKLLLFIRMLIECGACCLSIPPKSIHS